MVIPVTSAGFSHIQSELGGSNPIYMGEYYTWTEESGTTSTVGMDQFIGGFGLTVGKHSITAKAETRNYFGYSEEQNWNVQNGTVTSTTMIMPAGTLGAVYYATQENRVTYVVNYGSNAGFTTLKIKGYSYARTSAAYSYSSPWSTWIWNTTTDPFGGTYGDDTLIQVI